jgi:hypothetical protein
MLESGWGLTRAIASSSLPSDVAYTDVNNSWTTVQNLPNLSTVGTNVVLSNSGLTAARTYTFPDLTDTIVTLTATQSLTSKTLSSPTLSGTVAGTPTISSAWTWSTAQAFPNLTTVGTNVVISATGLTGARTFTFPDLTDTVVGLAATQTLTNKTYDGESNTPKNMLPAPSVERHGAWWGVNANGTGAASGLWSTGINVAGTVTGNNPTATEGAFTRFDTTAVQNTQAGIRESTNFITTPGLNCLWKFRFRVNNNVGRFFIVVLNSGTFQTGDEPLANLSGIAFGFRSTDTNWTVERNTGSATGTFDTTPFGAFDTNIHTLKIFFNGATNVQVTLDSTTATYSTTIPATSTTLTHQITMTNSDSAASRTFDLWYMQVRSDK